MTLMQRDHDDQYHPIVDGFLSRFKFADFEFERMNFYLKKSFPENYQPILVPAIFKGQDDVFVVLNFLCVQEVSAMDFECP
jgi:hypothetical protein